MIRRAWRVLADPPGSGTAGLLRIVIPFVALVAVLALPPLLDLRHMPKLMDVAWLTALLYVVRQRDQARGDAACHLWQTVERIGNVITQECEVCHRTRTRVQRR